MSGPVQLKINIPISSVAMVDEPDSTDRPDDNAQAEEDRSVQSKREITAACSALQQAAAQLNQSYEQIFSSHREQIVRLSLEIAAKILLKDISDGNYKIEKIINEALAKAPPGRDIVVRINPADLQQLEEASKKSGESLFDNVKLVPDQNVGCAECVVQTDKGMIEYYVQEHLKQVTEALEAMN